MFQIVNIWNLTRPDKEMSDRIQDINFRGSVVHNLIDNVKP